MDGEIAIATTPTQCLECSEDGCPGKEGLSLPINEPDGPSETEAPTLDMMNARKMEINSIYGMPSLADIIAKQAAERERLLNAFNDHTKGTLQDIMTGECTEFLIIYKTPTGVIQRGLMTKSTKMNALTSIAMKDLEDKIGGLTNAPGWMDKILADLFK
jgi:hypothetical protein